MICKTACGSKINRLFGSFWRQFDRRASALPERRARLVWNRLTRLTLSTFVVATIIVFSYGTPLAAQEPERQVVRVGVHDAWPFALENEEGAFVGFALEVMDAIAEIYDWEIVHVPGDWSPLHSQLENGEIDILFPYSNSIKDEVVVVEPPLNMAWGGLFSKRPDELKTPQHIEGKSIVAVEDDLFGMKFEAMLRQLGIGCDLLYAADLSPKNSSRFV